MRYLSFLLTILFFCLLLPMHVSASEGYAQQGETVLSFYETVLEKQIPSVADFISLFGQNNEAELDLILHQKFPNINGAWGDDEKTVKYTKKVYEQPDKFPSLFFKCIRENDFGLFSELNKYYLFYPPDTVGDFNRFTVMSGARKINFVFSQNENFIEDIILPDGTSIYTRLKKCYKSQ